MKGNNIVIQHLNKVLSNELAAINQYFLHSRMYQDWGFEKLGALEYEESLDEMKHADSLVKRILFLEGAPNIQDLSRVYIGKDPKEILELDLQIEYIGHADLVAGIKYCESIGDFVTRKLLVEIISSEEEHIDWLESQLTLIKKLGIENYLQSQMIA